MSLTVSKEGFVLSCSCGHRRLIAAWLGVRVRVAVGCDVSVCVSDGKVLDGDRLVVKEREPSTE
jgi:hypothetical protein